MSQRFERKPLEPKNGRPLEGITLEAYAQKLPWRRNGSRGL
jgi:hypothetical protein